MTSLHQQRERTITAIEAWLGLHVELENWHIKFDEAEEHLHPLKDRANLTYLGFLKGFPAKQWAMIGDGAGWTPVAAMALSWCEGATWESVLKAWQSIESLDLESTVSNLAAQMTNPKFLPEPNLAAVLKIGGTPGGAWVILTALKLHGKFVQYDETLVPRSSVHSALWPLIEQPKRE
ncbi:hypothetical protein [Pseudovibrio brasiliensis]|jgi:hypothetical protein|uniref:Uncharacterized protein n=1 Tax=Pseudovibrio brasiliensis TaxID=1898042 RepID=A0ABX8AZN2_9HYPH|nr:hypothetical protein [Pseudovibrio brasiliensis]QUS59151.1 hypothetical protein KGB56_26520 [Pseudovibrio brasiliensis]